MRTAGGSRMRGTAVTLIYHIVKWTVVTEMVERNISRQLFNRNPEQNLLQGKVCTQTNTKCLREISGGKSVHLIVSINVDT